MLISMNGERWLRIYPKQLKRIDDPSLLFVLKNQENHIAFLCAFARKREK